MDVSPRPPTQIRDIKSKRLRKKRLDELIPWSEQKLAEMIDQRASLEAIIAKVEAFELAKNHDGLCAIMAPCSNCEGIDSESCVFEEQHETCERFYGHTGPHSWEGGGVG